MEEKMLKLKCIEYNEKTLVDKICTEKQKAAYCKKEKFPGGMSQKSFWSKLSDYCNYEYDPETRKYKVLNVFERPKTRAEKKVHGGIYQYIAPLMLDEFLSNKENKLVFVFLDLAKNIGVVNDNYNCVKFHQDAANNDLKFLNDILFDYFRKTDSCIDYYIQRSLMHLQSIGCIKYKDVHIIGFLPKEISLEGTSIIVEDDTRVEVATEKEMDLYLSIVEKASILADIENEREKWYGKKSMKYFSVLRHALREHGIEFVRKAFQVYQIDEDRCKEILASFADKTLAQRKREVGDALSAIVIKNAESRLAKNPDLGNEYLDQFKRLSSIVLSADAENIATMMPSVEDDSQKKLKRRCGYKIEYRVRRDKNAAK